MGTWDPYKYNGRLNRRNGHKALVRSGKWAKVWSKLPRTLRGVHTRAGLTLYDYVFFAIGGSKRWHKRNFIGSLKCHQQEETKFDLSYLLQQSLILQKKLKLTQVQRRRLQSAISMMQKYV